MRMSIKDIEKQFSVSLSQAKNLIRGFHSEMNKGLRGSESSLKMLPTFIDTPTGEEKGRFLGLDLGGTNLRISQIELKGRAKFALFSQKKLILKKKYTTGNSTKLFDFIALAVKKFTEEKKINIQGEQQIGFTFSFPVKQTAVNCGVLINWTKGFSAKDAINADVVNLLNEAFKRKKMSNVKITALVNDTTATLLTGSYKDPDCDVGLILGTGTNACYRERVSGIHNRISVNVKNKKMIINTEWGNFNKLKLTYYDKLLDNLSDNPGYQILEKTVSGMYLGKLTGLIANDLVKRNILFSGFRVKTDNIWRKFKTEYMGKVEQDNSYDLDRTNFLLKELNILDATFKDRLLLKKICRLVSRRASGIIAAVLAALILKIDPALLRKHTVAIDGSVYEKYPKFSKKIKAALKRVLGNKGNRIKLVLTKDGSCIGAAVAAAVATRE